MNELTQKILLEPQVYPRVSVQNQNETISKPRSHFTLLMTFQFICTAALFDLAREE